MHEVGLALKSKDSVYIKYSIIFVAIRFRHNFIDNEHNFIDNEHNFIDNEHKTK